MKAFAVAIALVATCTTAHAGTFKFGNAHQGAYAAIFSFVSDALLIGTKREAWSQLFFEWNGPYPSEGKDAKPANLAEIRKTLPVEFGFDATRKLDIQAVLIEN